MARYPDTVTSTWSPARLGDMTGKRVIVTGATNGVGLGTARALAKADAHVIVAVRNTELSAQRAAEIGGSTTVLKLDLADLSSVRAFADRLDDDVDILVNNAGALAEKRSDTVDGFEITIGTNLLGPFALTNLIFGRVRSQIINVGSDAHRSATLRLDDMHLRTHEWTALGAYARSKLAVMLWGLELDRRLRAAHSPVVTHLTIRGSWRRTCRTSPTGRCWRSHTGRSRRQPAWSLTTSTPGQRPRCIASPSPSRPAAMSASTACSAFAEYPF